MPWNPREPTLIRGWKACRGEGREEGGLILREVMGSKCHAHDHCQGSSAMAITIIEDALRASTAAPSLRDLSRGTLPKKI